MSNNMYPKYKVNWKNKGQKYQLWLVDHPEIMVEGDHVIDMQDDLETLVEETFDVTLPIFEHIRDLPIDVFPARYGPSEYICLSPGGFADLKAPLQQYFAEELCSTCKHVDAKRNETPLVFDNIGGMADYLYITYSNLVIVSEQLKDVLQLEQDFELRPVLSAKKRKKRFYEVVAKAESQILTDVAVGPEADKLGRFLGHYCEVCGSSSHPYLNVSTSYNLVDKQTLKEPLHRLYLLWEHLVLKRKLWQQLSKDHKLKGVEVSQLGLADAADIITPDEYYAHYKHGENYELDLCPKYQIDWRKIDQGYQLWLVKHPEIMVEGNYVTTMEKRLGRLIESTTNAVMPIFEYVRELPDNVYPARYGSSEYICLSPGGSADLKTPLQQYFATPLCQCCKALTAKRNEIPLRITKRSGTADLMYIFFSGLIFVSEKLKDILQLDNEFELRKVLTPKDYPHRVYEVFAKSPSQVLTDVAVGPEADIVGKFTGFNCEVCGTISHTYMRRDDPYKLIDKQQLQQQQHRIYLLDNHLVIKRELWQQLSKDHELKGVDAIQLGLADRADIITPKEYNRHFKHEEKL